MHNKTASAPSKTTSPTEMTLSKCSPGGHVSKRSRGAVILASDFSALRVSLSDCIKDAILRWLIDHSSFDGGERRHESYVRKRATVNTESPPSRKIHKIAKDGVSSIYENQGVARTKGQARHADRVE